jgi:hypothetical protein
MTEPVDWSTFRKCPVCFAQIGRPCTSLTGTFAGGRVDAVVNDRDRPHSRRKLRTRAVSR